MPYNFVADSFHTKKLCSRLSSSEVRFYTENGRFVFWDAFGGLEATYDNHLRLIEKHAVDFHHLFSSLHSPLVSGLGPASQTGLGLRATLGSSLSLSNSTWPPSVPGIICQEHGVIGCHYTLRKMSRKATVKLAS